MDQGGEPLQGERGEHDPWDTGAHSGNAEK